MNYGHLIFASVIGGLILADPLQADVSKSDVARQMIAEGRWTIATSDSRGNDYHVDPYTIVKVSPTVFQINTLGPPIDPIWNRAEPDHLRAKTVEFDCAARRYAHIGWRSSKGFRGRSIIGGKAWNKLDVNLGNDPRNPAYLVEHFIAQHVCGYEQDGKFVMDAVGVRTNTQRIEKISVFGNRIYYDDTKKIAKIDIQRANSAPSLFAKCDEGRGIASDLSGNFQELKVLDPILLDWVCKGLHPATEKVLVSLEMPILPSTSEASPRGSEGASKRNESITNAKKKCGELGFQSGTEKFGACVLRLSQ